MGCRDLQLQVLSLSLLQIFNFGQDTAGSLITYSVVVVLTAVTTDLTEESIITCTLHYGTWARLGSIPVLVKVFTSVKKSEIENCT